MPTALDDLMEPLARALPQASPARQRTLTALAAAIARFFAADLSYSAEELRRLRGALARIEAMSLDEREAVVEAVERELFGIATADRTQVVAALAGLPQPQLYDAFVDLDATAGLPTAVYALGLYLPGDPTPGDRAEQLGIEIAPSPSFVHIGSEDVLFDRSTLSIGRGMHAIVVPWSRLERLVGIDPWPGVRVRRREAGYPGDAFFRAKRDPEVVARRIAELFEFAREHLGTQADRVIERGWVGRPDVTWEEVDGFPEEPTPGDAGVYRTAAKLRPTEPILARRDAPSSWERLLLWLASKPEEPFGEHVGEVVVTEAHLYAERPGRAVARLPLWALRTRLGWRDGVYVFGQRTRVILPQREGPCPVAQHLDRVLRERA